MSEDRTRARRSAGRDTFHISEVLDSVLPPRSRELDDIHRILCEVLDEELMRRITLVSYRRAVISLKTDSSCLLHEIRSNMVQKIVEACRNEGRPCKRVVLSLAGPARAN